ncbi:hypothetical protein [Streptomyces sp. NPDC018059]
MTTTMPAATSATVTLPPSLSAAVPARGQRQAGPDRTPIPALARARP